MKVALWIVVLLVIAIVLVMVARRQPAPVPAAPATVAPETLVAELRRDVVALCGLGERSTMVPEGLAAAADLIESELEAAGYRVERQTYRVERDGVVAANLVAEIRGRTRRDEIVVIGAHYDSVTGTIGADDNASGVAGMLALARRFARAKPGRTLRFVAFVNEEPPHFHTHDMGSWQYAKRCHDRGETIEAMVSLETIGYYSDQPHSQGYPPPISAFYPGTGNFIAFASNVGSLPLNAQCVRAFRARTTMPVESASLPEVVTGIGWSDHWSFWQFDWPAIMVSDTAVFRNPHYHEPSDLPPTLDYARLAQVVQGLVGVTEELTASR
jgi:hypothetical protein